MNNEEQILATLQKLLEAQERTLAIQKQALENQREAITNQQISLKSQLAIGRIYRVAISVAAVILAMFLYSFFHT